MNTNQPAVYDPLTRALHWLTVAGFIGILTTNTAAAAAR